ncbi:hypothetical protein TNCV_97381 [Trichonephila clavipes]|nr:hypothetical protein TNCV_97381 [Trichonephila clavipes]
MRKLPSENVNGSSLPHPIPPNYRHGKERAREEKGERGHRVTCVILVKKLDNCPRLRLVNLPIFRLVAFSPRYGNNINGRISCSHECTMPYDRALRHTSSVKCLETFRSILAQTHVLPNSKSQMIPDMLNWRQIWG